MDQTGVRGVLVHLDRIALLERDGVPGNVGPFYTFPGGTVEPGEGERLALMREMWEESGLAVGIGPMITTLDFERPDGTVIHNHFYWVFLSFPTVTLPTLKLTGEELQRPPEVHGTYTPVWVPLSDWELLDVRPAELHQQLIPRIRSIGR